MVNNKVILIGRMTKDAAVVDAKEGQGKIAHFSLAVDKMKRKAEQVGSGDLDHFTGILMLSHGRSPPFCGKHS